jgi:membrane protein YqaA with SNARE-associated domain
MRTRIRWNFVRPEGDRPLYAAPADHAVLLVPVVAALALPALETLKQLFLRYTEWVAAILKPLGAWAVFAIAGIDSAFFGIPLDPVVAAWVYHDRSRFLLYPLLAAAGSAAGCVLLYLVGYRGGEALIEKRISKAKFAKIRQSFDRHEFWALMFPAMMPPPFPFKLFVLSASIFEMNFWHFLLAIFAGRMVRFLILSVLVLEFGPQVVQLASALAASHWLAFCLTAVSAAGIVAWVWYRARRKRPEGARQA